MWLLHLIKEPVAEFQLIVKIIGNKRVSVSKDETKVFRLFPGEVVVLVGLDIGNITSLCIVGNIRDVERSRCASVDEVDVEFACIEDELHAEDAELGTVRVSQQPVEMPDIQHDVDAELGTALVFSSTVSYLTLCLFKPSQFGLWKRFVKSSYFLSSSYIRAL
ncbi:hypothetical protein TNCV_693321 [Trichonephila clavipes]|nr:hypothetical protein TNCV_693321 [Trichonephila clavipes]